MDRILGVTDMVKERVNTSSSDLQDRFYTKYRAFLESELEKFAIQIPAVDGWSGYFARDDRIVLRPMPLDRYLRIAIRLVDPLHQVAGVRHLRAQILFRLAGLDLVRFAQSSDLLAFDGSVAKALVPGILIPLVLWQQV